MARPSPRTALQTIIDRPDVVAGICKTHGVGLLTAFGSAARDEPDPADLDLAYAAEEGRTVDVLGFLSDLVDLTGTDRMDLLDLDRAGVVAAQRATTRCVPLCESTPGAFAEMQIRAVVRFADTQWLRDEQLRSLATG